MVAMEYSYKETDRQAYTAKLVRFFFFYIGENLFDLIFF